ncbi:WG repeat-containing protein [Spirosoma arcticum]
MPENPTTALVKTAQSPALARVSNQLALTDKLLTKPEEPFLIPYRKGDKWGFCDRNKNIVIDCVYFLVEPFEEGLAVVVKNDRYGHIDKKGQVVISIVYENATSFCFEGGCAGVMYNDSWLIINKSDEVVRKFSDSDFGWTEFYEKQYWAAGLELIPIPATSYYGYVDKEGTEYWED